MKLTGPEDIKQSLLYHRLVFQIEEAFRAGDFIPTGDSILVIINALGYDHDVRDLEKVAQIYRDRGWLSVKYRKIHNRNLDFEASRVIEFYFYDEQ